MPISDYLTALLEYIDLLTVFIGTYIFVIMVNAMYVNTGMLI